MNYNKCGRDNVVINYDQNGDIINLEIMKINLAEFVGSKNSNKALLE
ncbi:MAG: hypothetical protein L7H18_04600 [Candidatus Nealsonbacteria bacterium DGGOD1a]|jgi:hypothetical protein|nr:MAG: hypothetical protein L7H18_04600 [Candidatus Nealsonbacteria bacterium DGGOD1a]